MGYVDAWSCSSTCDFQNELEICEDTLAGDGQPNGEEQQTTFDDEPVVKMMQLPNGEFLAAHSTKESDIQETYELLMREMFLLVMEHRAPSPSPADAENEN